MRAIQSTTLGVASIVEVPEPELKPNTIIVRPTYIGNNPCDYLVTDMELFFTPKQMLGCDYSGIVERIGSDVKTDLKPGDKVCGGLAGGTGTDLTRGAFAELIPAYSDFVFPVPTNVTDAQAATLGVALSTAAVAFYQHFGFPLPDEDGGATFGQGKPFFIYGGSSAMGLFGIQFAKLAGFKVIVTCSEKNFGLVKEYGADEAYDYHDFEQCTKEIQRSVGDELRYAYVCVIGGRVPKVRSCFKPVRFLKLTCNSSPPISSQAKAAPS